MNIKKMTRKDRHGGMFSIEFDTPEVPQMDHPGEPRGTDTHPAWLTPGENVVNAEASRKYQPVIDAMNEEGRMMQEAQGGPIPTYASNNEQVGKNTGNYTQYGRPIFRTDEGKYVSERGRSIPIMDMPIGLGQIYNIPSIQNGVERNEDYLRKGIRDGSLEPTGIFNSLPEAIENSIEHSKSIRPLERFSGGPVPTYAAGGSRPQEGKDFWWDGRTYRPHGMRKRSPDMFSWEALKQAAGGATDAVGGIPEYLSNVDWTPWNSGGAKVPSYHSDGYRIPKIKAAPRPEVNLTVHKTETPTSWSVQENVPATTIHDGSEESLIPPISPSRVIEEPMPVRRPPEMPPLLPEGDVRIPTGEKDSSVYDLLEPPVVMDDRSDSSMALPVPLSAYANTDRANEIPRYLSHPSYEMKTNDLMGYLVSKGLSPEQAAGIVGNFAHETGSYVPNKTFSGNTIKDTIDFGTFQKGGPGRGAAQWGGASVTLSRAEHPKEGPTKIVNGIKFRWDPKANVDNKGAYVYDRFANLKEFAESQDREWRDPLIQLEFMMQEPEWAELTKNKKWKGADTPQLASQIFQDIFERAGATAYGKRNVFADQVMENYKYRSGGGKIPSYYSSGGQVPQYYASGSGSWWDPRSWFGSSQPSTSTNPVVSAPAAGHSQAHNMPVIASNNQAVPPVVQTPPKPVGEDQGEYGVHDTIVRNGVPYVWNEEKEEYVDAEDREYTRGFGEFLGDAGRNIGDYFTAPTSNPNYGPKEGEILVGERPDGYPVYKTPDGKFVAMMGPNGKRLGLSSWDGSEDEIIFNEPAGRTAVPPKLKPEDKLVPLPGVSKTKQDTDGVSEEQVEKEGDKGKTDDPAGWEAAYGWVKSNFGHMFDKKLLARMATLYLGSRILGYEHLDSARYAAKDYLDELDSQGQSGFVKRGGKVYHRKLGVLPTYIAGDKREYVNVNGTPYRLDDPQIVPYLEDYQASLHDLTEIRKEFRTTGKTYLDGVNQPIEKEVDQVPDRLNLTISDEAASLYNKEKKRFGGLSAPLREDVIRNLNLAQDEYYRDYARWIRDGREDGLEPKSLEVYYQKRKIANETGGIVSSSDVEGTEAKVFGKIDNQIQSKAFAGLDDKTRADLAAKEYKRIWATYKTTWTKYTALANAGKAPKLWLKAGGTGVNPFMNWVRECLNKNSPSHKKALKVFQDIKQ